MFLILLTNWQQIDKPKGQPHLEAYGYNRSIRVETIAPTIGNLEGNFSRRRHVGGFSANFCCSSSCNSRFVSWPTLQSKAQTCLRLDVATNSISTHHRSLHPSLVMVNLRCLEGCDSYRIPSTKRLGPP